MTKPSEESLRDREKRLKQDAIAHLEYAIAHLKGGADETPSMRRWNEARSYIQSAYDSSLIGRTLCQMRIDEL